MGIAQELHFHCSLVPVISCVFLAEVNIDVKDLIGFNRRRNFLKLFLQYTILMKNLDEIGIAYLRSKSAELVCHPYFKYSLLSIKQRRTQKF